MKLLLSIVALAIPACTSTELWNDEGKRILRVGSNARGVSYTNGATSFTAVELAPSETLGAMGGIIRRNPNLPLP